MLERLADMIRAQDTRAGFEATPDMLSITGMTLEQFADLLQGLGYQAERGEREKQRPQPMVAPSEDTPAAEDAIAPSEDAVAPVANTAETVADTAEPVAEAAEAQEPAAPEQEVFSHVPVGTPQTGAPAKRAWGAIARWWPQQTRWRSRGRQAKTWQAPRRAQRWQGQATAR